MGIHTSSILTYVLGSYFRDKGGLINLRSKVCVGLWIVLALFSTAIAPRLSIYKPPAQATLSC